MTAKRFQVALSFPGEHRDYVSQVAEVLKQSLGKDKVFYDQWYAAELARPNMDVLLQSFYHDHSELLVPFYVLLMNTKSGADWNGGQSGI